MSAEEETPEEDNLTAQEFEEEGQEISAEDAQQLVEEGVPMMTEEEAAAEDSVPDNQDG